MELPRAAVIAEALPEPQHLGLGRGCQRGDRRQGLRESLEVRNDRGDLRLLEHDFAQPDVVGVASAPPGEVAGVTGVPGEQTAAECAPPGVVMTEGGRDGVWLRGFHAVVPCLDFLPGLMSAAHNHGEAVAKIATGRSSARAAIA